MLLLIEKSCAARKAPVALGASKPSSFDISEAIDQSMDRVRLLFLGLMVTVTLFIDISKSTPYYAAKPLVRSAYISLLLLSLTILPVTVVLAVSLPVIFSNKTLSNQRPHVSSKAIG